jgi:aspartate/methionine/tyrosine aminotransferase
MQIKIKNREALLSHGDVEGRKIVLDITEKTLQHLDAYERIKNIPYLSMGQPGGTFYVFPNIEKTGLSSKEFCGVLFEKCHILATPGSSFGAS